MTFIETMVLAALGEAVLRSHMLTPAQRAASDVFMEWWLGETTVRCNECGTVLPVQREALAMSATPFACPRCRLEAAFRLAWRQPVALA